MNTLSIRLRYRPLRLGWCVLRGDTEAFRRAARLSFTMWGGRYNPILPVDDLGLATALVKLFRVDALVQLSEGAAVDAFLAAHKHLPWPMMSNGLFVGTMRDGKVPAIVDISHPAIRLYEEFIKNNPNAQPGLDFYDWENADPLADVFLCSLGAFPSAEECGVDYAALVQTSLLGIGNVIQREGVVPVPRVERETIATLNCAYMQQHYAVQNHRDWPGFYVGEANNFDDLVNFWNLRAAGIQLKFLDPLYASRLGAGARHWTATIQQMPPTIQGPQHIALWHRAERPIEDVSRDFGDSELIQCDVHESIWNGHNVRAPIMYFGDGTALASVDESGGAATISFALTDKPFAEGRDAHEQHYVLSVNPGIGLYRNEQATLHTPFIPELNEFYGRKAHTIWNVARSEPDSLGIVTSAADNHETLHALNANELVIEIFGQVGIEAAPSKAGLIASTLIRQMGGLDGCRAFRIAGVRTLIENHKPHQSFDRSAAMQIIRGQGHDRPLSDYQELYIEPRKVGSELKNSSVLSYLLEKGVFRAGLKFDCPSCQLEFWRSLDDARSRLECDYCGHGFNAAPQLRDKAWAFRRSGLFGNDDHQEGAIPVLLTLQQLGRMHSMSHGVFTTAMTLKSKDAAIPDCETDFVVMAERGRDHRIQIAIGEAKTRKPITANDVAKLKAVADTFPADRYDVYVVFARLTPFSADEIELIKQANGKYARRAIMLTERELEPYFVYERTAKEFDIERTAVSFENMAIATARVFFEQRRREGH
ncbi:MAG: hypothetical protein Q8M19_20240 [Reyranella sp.]|nr:hypothetical protein [Reyranella sp.]